MVAADRVIRIALFGQRYNGIGRMFLPVDQCVVPAGGDASAGIDAVVDHGGDALFINEGSSGVHLLLGIFGSDAQGNRVVLPIQQVRARGVTPESQVLDLAGVEEMIAALPVDTSLGIKGITNAVRRGEVVFRLMRIALGLGTVN